MNEILFFIILIIMFTIIILLHKFFGKAGLFAFIAMSVILANIEVSCQVNMFNLPDGWVTLGNVSFASIFLATDILNECYGYKESKKAVNLALIVIIVFLLLIQLDLLFITDNPMHELLSQFFGIDGTFIWVTFSSIICFYLANLVDVWLFEKIRQKTGDKKLWLRNNLATISANCVENFLFAFLGYYLLPLIFTGNPIQPLTLSLGICVSTCLIEVIISLLDTPFVYLARKIKIRK